jgi:hypothetical protein
MLQVRETGHDGLDVLSCTPYEDPSEGDHFAPEAEELVAQAETQTGGHLVVPRPADMHAPSGLLTDHLRESGFDPGVDVFILGVIDQRRQSLLAEAQEASEEQTRMRPLEDPLSLQHQHMRHVDQKVRVADPPVRPCGREKCGDVAGPLSLEPSAPHYIPIHAVPY